MVSATVRGPRRHLVVGASGQLGRQVVGALRREGGIEVCEAELNQDLAAAAVGVTVAHLTVDLRPPLRRHRALWSPPEELQRLVLALRTAGVRRLVHLSSAHVHGVSSSTPVDETTPSRPLHTCERLRLHDEEWLLAQPGLEVVVLRPSHVLFFGEPVLESLLAKLRSGRLNLPGGGRALRTFLLGADLGRAFAAAATRGRPGRAYLLAGFESSWRELLEGLASQLGLGGGLGSVPRPWAWLRAVVGWLRVPSGAESWPGPYTVELLGGGLLVDDARSRRELSWSPLISGLQEALEALVRPQGLDRPAVR